MTATLVDNWPLLLVATAFGLALGVALAAVSYLTPLVRLYLATDAKDRAHVPGGELVRLRRLGDAAAVSGEYGLTGAEGLRKEAELRSLFLLLAAGTPFRG